MQRFDISCRKLGQSRILMTDPSDINRLIACEWNRNNLIPVQVSAQHPGRNGIAIQADEQIEQGRAIIDPDAFLWDNVLRISSEKWNELYSPCSNDKYG